MRARQGGPTRDTQRVLASAINRLKHINVSALDSVQVLAHQEYFNTREPRHELIMLRLLECTPLHASTPQLMCGREPWLRPCVDGEPALRRLASCTGSVSPFGKRIAKAVASLQGGEAGGGGCTPLWWLPGTCRCTNSTCFRDADGRFHCPE